MKTKLSVSAPLIIFLIFISLCSCAKQGKSLVVYTALEDDQINAYLAPFKKDNPDITIHLVRDSTGVLTARLIAEKDNPRADVIWGLAATSLLILDERGMLEPYAPAGLERVLPKFRDRRSVPHWVGIDAYMTGLVINTVEISGKKLPIPKGYRDLLNPAYRGQIVMPNPASSGTGYLTVNAILQIFGEKGGWEYLDRLHENIAFYTHSGSKPAKLAGQGEYAIGISFGYRGIIQKAKGEPVVTVFPREGSGWDLEANALVKKKVIKEEARRFLDWAIGDEVMALYNKNFAVISLKKGGVVPEGFPENPLRQMIENDLRWSAENRDVILEQWNARYGSKSEKK